MDQAPRSTRPTRPTWSSAADPERRAARRAPRRGRPRRRRVRARPAVAGRATSSLPDRSKAVPDRLPPSRRCPTTTACPGAFGRRRRRGAPGADRRARARAGHRRLGHGHRRRRRRGHRRGQGRGRAHRGRPGASARPRSARPTPPVAACPSWPPAARLGASQRSPEEVRKMLSRYRSGLNKGRGRADSEDQ